MAVLLSRAYGGYAAGTVCEFPSSTETALIAQKFAVTSAAKPTAGAVTTNQLVGKASIAAGAASVVVTQAQVNSTSKIVAQVSQSAADGTLTSILRVTPAAGSFTITGNANATADTEVAWEVVALNVA
jgi:hypothetical protein